jgi:ribosomal protein S18 acetylase RimI-like enzyme
MIKIRHAGKDDVSVLQKLNNELFQDNQKFDPDLKMDWPMSDKGSKYFSELIDSNESYVLIAEDDGNPVGYLIAEVRDIEYRNGKSIFLENMEVNPESRHKGIGSILISELVNLANEKGIKKIYATSYLKNNNALGFYRKNGFKDIDITLEKTV